MMAEHAEMLARHGIDYADALDRFGGNGALYERLARKYAEDPHFDRLVRALGEGDAAAAYHEAHSLKGVAGNLSFADLHQAAARASELLRTGNVPAARDALPAVRHAHENALAALRQLAEG